MDGQLELFEARKGIEDTPFAKELTRAYRLYQAEKSPQRKQAILDRINYALNYLFEMHQEERRLLAKMKWRGVWCIVVKNLYSAKGDGTIDPPNLSFYDIDPDAIILPYLLETEVRPGFELPENGIYVY